METKPSRPDTNSNAIATAPVANPEAKRLTGVQLLQRVKQFAFRLNANARWMKQFLHRSP
jgi:hypothetical protein